MRHRHAIHHIQDLAAATAADVHILQTLVADLQLRSVSQTECRGCGRQHRPRLQLEDIGRGIKTRGLPDLSLRHRTPGRGDVLLDHLLFGHDRHAFHLDGRLLQLHLHFGGQIHLHPDAL